MPKGYYERKRRMPRRFCREGHDMYLPHGTYLKIYHNGPRAGKIEHRCAVCLRAWFRKHWAKKHAK